MKKPFTDTVTLFNFIGENGGEAVWYRTVLTGVHTRHTDRTGSGRDEKPHSEAVFYFSDRESRAEGKVFTSPDDFIACPTSGAFTFRPGKDLFCFGVCSAQVPPEDCYLISSSERHQTQRSRLSHRKVTGEK